MTVLHLYRKGFRNWLPDFNISPLFQGLFALLLVWITAPYWVYPLDATAAIPDVGLLLLILISIITFLILLWLSTYLLRVFLAKLGLPDISYMVSQFKELTLWEQYALYWLSFALLLLGTIACVAAIC